MNVDDNEDWVKEYFYFEETRASLVCIKYRV